MENILDILCDYSVRGKKVDYIFLNHVFQILRKGNEEFVSKLVQRNFNRDKLKSGVHIPMSYSYFNKKIYTHPDQIECIYSSLQNSADNTWSDLEKMFLFNSYILFDLLHEFEHVYQFDKIFNFDSSAEGKLLGLTNFAYRRIAEKSSISQFLISKFGVCVNEEIANLYIEFGFLNKIFNREVLYERLADIHACEKIGSLLENVDLEINRIRQFFSLNLVESLLYGYDKNKRIPFPMDRYILATKSLEIPEVNQYVNEVVFPCIREVLNSYERISLGLYATDEELEDLRKILK